MRKSVVEYVAGYAASTPDKVAVVVNNEETSYKQLYEMVCGYCNYLQKAGLQKGQPITIFFRVKKGKKARNARLI